MKVAVIGAGVVGLTCALELAERGADVQVLEKSGSLGESACSWFAGGMLAPWCERENAEPLVGQLGEEAVGWWAERFPATVRRGTLVVAHPRDVVELTEFARRTQHYETLDRTQLTELEPDLPEHFSRALYFPTEAHLDPRIALASLANSLQQRGVELRFGNAVSAAQERELLAGGTAVVNCTGLAARDVLADLRGVRGEMLMLRAPEVRLHRPVRVLHARLPVYVVPRSSGVYMVGATVLESDEPGRVTARSVLELLTAAYALNPAFGEAEVLELGAGVRPAFADNLPRLRWRGGVMHVNGLYRHGFLLAPAMARRAAVAILENRRFAEVMDEDLRERRSA